MQIKMKVPKFRFTEWEPMSYPLKRSADTRTPKEVDETLEAFATYVPEVRKFLTELKNMNPLHKSLAADTVELSLKPAAKYVDVDLKQPFGYDGYSPLEKLMETLPEISANNPNAINFSNEVINNTDKLTSKFYLKEAANLEFMEDTSVAENFKKAIPELRLISDIALTSGSSKNFNRQKNFMNLVLSMINSRTDVNKFPLIKKIFDTINNTGSKFYLDDFLMSDVPVKTVEENLKTLRQAAGEAYSFGKVLDVNSYLTRKN